MELHAGWRAMARSLVPYGFDVPRPPATTVFRLEPLAEEHAAGDYQAWTSSIEHIRSTPGFVGWTWPPCGGMSAEENLASVRRHVRHHAARVGFTFAVVEQPTGVVIGCVYVYPAADSRYDCEVRSWVSADRAHLDRQVHDVVLEWLRKQWPFRAVLSHARS